MSPPGASGPGGPTGPTAATGPTGTTGSSSAIGPAGETGPSGAAGRAYSPRSEIFAEKTFHTYYEPMRAIRTARYKLIVNFEVSTRVDVPADVRESPIYPRMLPELNGIRPPVELYDLEGDRWEQHNLADDPEYADILSDLSQRLLAWMRSTDDPLLRGPVPSPYYADAVARLTRA
jgi:hypothetical protein